MKRVLTEKHNFGFDWMDVTNPTHEELHEIAVEYKLHESSVQDCLQPDHLPKFEPIGDDIFMILRMYNQEAGSEADTIGELTNKVAIFSKNELILTVHRQPLDFTERIKTEVIDTDKCRSPVHLRNFIVREILNTYSPVADKLAKSMHYYEDHIFLKQKTPPVLKGMYFLKRKVDLIRRILILTRDIIDHIDDPEEQDPSTRDTRDLFVRLQTVYDTLSDNINQLFNIYFSISSQKNNEVVRILTIFSVFFMPLTFIAGIYGMNFDFMPELRWKIGYPGVLVLMVGVVICIYFWFRRKGWL